MDMQLIIDKYEKAKEQWFARIMDFREGKRPFLVCIASPYTFYDNCNTVEDCFSANMYDFDKALDYPSDILPYLETWFGTGAYADAFGSKYEWHKGRSPACHYAYHKLDEIKDIRKPNIADGRIFKMILEAIEYFKDKTDGRLPG